MEADINMLNVDLEDFEVDSLENYYQLCEIMGAIALAVKEDYPDKKCLLVYEVPNES